MRICQECLVICIQGDLSETIILPSLHQHPVGMNTSAQMLLIFAQNRQNVSQTGFAKSFPIFLPLRCDGRPFSLHWKGFACLLVLPGLWRALRPDLPPGPALPPLQPFIPSLDHLPPSPGHSPAPPRPAHRLV